MGFSNLREFLQCLEREGELKRIPIQVSPELEITEITDRVVRAKGPALLFEKVEGSSIPVVTNLFGSEKRMALALGSRSLEQVSQRIKELLEVKMPRGLVARILHVLPKLKEISSFVPKLVKNAPCQEVVLDKADLGILPVLKCWPGDAGRFITLPLVITKDPETGSQNMGMYRMQVFDERTTGMHWHRHKGGALHMAKAAKRAEKMEVAVALGGSPATIYSATAPLPEGIDELAFAGFLQGKPVEVVKAKTLDLLVPAEAEIILEGHVDPNEPLKTEGPFGDHTGFYSPTEPYPVFHIETMTMRKEPIYPATIVGPPPKEDYFMGYATERIFLPLIQLLLPEVVDVHMPVEGVFHNLVFVAIRKQYPGHAYKVMHSLWGQGQMMFAKVIVVVDEDVDVRDPKEAWWVALNNMDPQRDVLITRGPADALDHSSPLPTFGSKMGIDGTRKWPEEGHSRPWPERIRMSEDVKRKVDELWKSLGL
jgi:4-hydroxy-3-polyprenylbenzoate decarboxylase